MIKITKFFGSAFVMERAVHKIACDSFNLYTHKLNDDKYFFFSSFFTQKKPHTTKNIKIEWLNKFEVQ